VKLQGTSRTEDLVNSLPQSFAGQGSNLSNGASGTATVNLRNLGAARTLVLVNGRRLQAGDPLSPYPDINFVPTQLIKRVDILTGGASSVYGADAVGGVVNFIMDNTFTGIRLDAQASTFQHNNRAGGPIIEANERAGYRPPHGLSTNGGSGDLAAVFGAAFEDGRGHVQAYATYRRQRALLESSRDYSFCALAARTAAQVTANPDRRFNCGGSATSPTGTFIQYDPATFTNVATYQVIGNDFVRGYSLFNYAPYNYYQRPDERYTLGAFADYEISSGFKPYLEAMFMDDHSDAQIAPSGDFGNTLTLNCDNALLSAQQLATICGNPALTYIDPNTGVRTALVQILRRNVEGGGRDDDIQHTDYRLVAGMRGDALAGLSYDLSYQYGRVLRNETYLHDFSTIRLTRALDVVADPVTGQPVCRSVLNGTDANCVPYNIFSAGGVTPAALAYLEAPGFQRGIMHETIAHADVTLSGEQYGLKTPWANNGIGFNAGVEYRKEQIDFNTDLEFQSGDLSGQGTSIKPISGQFDLREMFAETQIPIVEHNFIDLLQLSAGYRYSNYKVADNTFNTDTYKVAAEFAPVRDVRFRVSYNRAVRAPNVVELFAYSAVGLGATGDPCVGAAPEATLAQCQLTGVTAAQYGHLGANPANQYNGLAGGNTALTPEKADSLTAGVILQPRWIPGLAITADYFHIKVKNLIGAQTSDSVFAGCFAGDPTQCALVHRDQFGSIWLTPNGYVDIRNANFAGIGLETKGWDFSGSYSRRMGTLGTLNASLIGTLQGNTKTLGGAGTGHFNAGVYPINKWRHKFRVGFNMPNGLGLSGQWRHFSSATCAGVAACTRPANAKINAQNYFDLALTARVTNKFNIRLGANNLLDRAPPVIGTQVLAPVFGNGNTYPQIYDALGRYMFAGVSVDF
jgi:outer membrane receptor protein involved in Fe transport